MAFIREGNIIDLLRTREAWSKVLRVFTIFVYLPLGVLVALLTPDNILDYWWARGYTDFMASWLPFVAEVGQRTKVPATQFIAAVMNTVAALCSLSMIYGQLRHYLDETIERVWKGPRKQKMKLLFAVLFCLACAYVIFFLEPISNSPRSRDRFIIGSKLGMGLYGSISIAGGWWLGIAFPVVYVSSLLVLIKRKLMLKKNVNQPCE